MLKCFLSTFLNWIRASPKPTAQILVRIVVIVAAKVTAPRSPGVIILDANEKINNELNAGNKLLKKYNETPE